MPVVYQYVKPETIAHRTLIYGAPATGKTTMAVSLNGSEKFGPVLVVNIDEGLSAVSHMKGLREVKAHSYKDFDQVLHDLTLPLEKKSDFLKPVKTVIFDSLSAMRDELLIEFTDQQYKKARREDAWTPEWKDFGKVVNYVTDKLNELRAIGIHAILLAGEAPKMQGDVQVGIQPNLNAKLLSNVNYGLSHIWHASLDPKTARYRLQVGKRPGDILTKNRNPIFTEALRKLTRDQAKSRNEDPDKQENFYYILSHDHPTLPTLYDLYNQSGAEAAEQV